MYDLSRDELRGGRAKEDLRPLTIPEAYRGGWRVEEEFVNAIRGREKITRTNFEDGVASMEFTDSVTKSMNEGRAVEVAGL